MNLKDLRRHPVTAGLYRQKEYKTETQSALFVYGVYVHRDEIASEALIVLCNNVLANGSTLPARLRTHRGTNHTE